jgi:hypothetical protein
VRDGWDTEETQVYTLSENALIRKIKQKGLPAHAGRPFSLQQPTAYFTREGL